MTDSLLEMKSSSFSFCVILVLNEKSCLSAEASIESPSTLKQISRERVEGVEVLNVEIEKGVKIDD